MSKHSANASLTKEDIAVLDKIAKECDYEDWKAFTESFEAAVWWNRKIERAVVLARQDSVSIEELKKICKKFSFEQMGILARYDPKKMQESIKVSDLLVAVSKKASERK